MIKTLVLVVHGVKSKESKGSGELKAIRVAAESRGIKLVELVTTHEGHCETLVRECDVSTVDAFGVMGGDGTLREGVSGMASRPDAEHRPIFAFPCGTGNNFARDLRLRTIEDCFAAIDRGVVHAVDAVKVTHPGGVTYSVNCVTWGMARDAAETAEGMRWLGPVRYDVAGFWHILKGKLNFAKLAASASVSFLAKSMKRSKQKSFSSSTFSPVWMMSILVLCGGPGVAREAPRRRRKKEPRKVSAIARARRGTRGVRLASTRAVDVTKSEKPRVRVVVGFGNVPGRWG